MNIFLARFAAAIAGFLVLAVLNRLGLEISEDQKQTLIAWTTQGVTGLGMLIWMVLYGIFHKTIDKKLNPIDKAAETLKTKNF